MGSIGDGEVGLTRTSGTNAEYEIDLFQRADISALRWRARLNDAAAGRNLRLAVGGRGFLARVPYQPVEIAGANLLAGGDARIELLQHRPGDLAGGLWAIQNDDVAVRVRFYAEAILDQRKVAIVLSQELGEVPVVFERHHDALVRNLNLRGPARSGNRVPAKCCQSELQSSSASNRHFLARTVP